MTTKKISITISYMTARMIDARAKAGERSSLISRSLDKYEVILSSYFDKLRDYFTPEEWIIIGKKMEELHFDEIEARTIPITLTLIIDEIKKQVTTKKEKLVIEIIEDKINNLSIAEMMVLSDVFRDLTIALTQ
ncbi:MAG: hypothetical protein ABSB78_14255 [Bacteroidota bacterium]